MLLPLSSPHTELTLSGRVHVAGRQTGRGGTEGGQCGRPCLRDLIASCCTPFQECFDELHTVFHLHFSNQHWCLSSGAPSRCCPAVCHYLRYSSPPTPLHLLLQRVLRFLVGCVVVCEVCRQEWMDRYTDHLSNSG